MTIHDNKEQFLLAIKATARELQIAQEFVEKDYWICHILQQLSRHPSSERIVWKGGNVIVKSLWADKQVLV